MTRATAVLAAVLMAACEARPALVTLQTGPPLRLEPAPGVRINARLKPALELAGGRVLHFDSPLLTSDSAYFTAPPTAAAPPGERAGTLRVSVCPAGERICRSLTIAAAW
jgi:hypothetical protein